MQIRIVLLLTVIISLLISCDFSLGDKNISAVYPGEGFISSGNTGNLTAYEPVDLNDLIDSDKNPENIGSSSEIDRTLKALSDVFTVLNGSFFESIAKGTGLNNEEFFGYEHIKPRSVSSSFEFHALDEGIRIIDGQDMLYEVNADYLDFIASLECRDFVRFFLNYLIRGRYNYSYDYIKADGKVGTSFKLSSSGTDRPAMIFNGFLNVEAKDLKLDEYNFNGMNGIGKVFISVKGGLKVGGALSFAKSGFMYSVNAPDHGGFPAIEEGNYEQKFAYHPYCVSLYVRESILADCSKLYDDIVSIMKSGSSLISEELYNTIAEALWPDHGSGNIILTVKYADGVEYVLSDWTLFQFVFAN